MSLMHRAIRSITAATDCCNSCERPANINGGILTQIIWVSICGPQIKLANIWFRSSITAAKAATDCCNRLLQQLRATR